jgi:hypothetical protein
MCYTSMETATKKPSKKTAVISPDMRITVAYIDYLLNHGKRPASVFKFSQDLGIKEEEFYNHFGSFDSVERKIWLNFISRTTVRLQADEAYAAFSAREKILTFYYAFFEELKSNRSYALLQLQHQNKFQITPEYLKDFRKAFDTFFSEVIPWGRAMEKLQSAPLSKTVMVISYGFILDSFFCFGAMMTRPVLKKRMPLLRNP